jgi:hypothetical protein
MKTLETPGDIREYIKEMMLKNISKYNFDSIDLLREMTDRIIFAIDLYIDLKIDLAIRHAMHGAVAMEEVKNIPNCVDSIEVAKSGGWKRKKR